MNLSKIPRNIFQCISNDNTKTLTQSWKTINDSYLQFLYNDHQGQQFIKTHFGSHIYDIYCKIYNSTLGIELWKYCILYIYGGVYVDSETVCESPINNILNETVEFVTVISPNNTLNGIFIASIPKHPILLNCINYIVSGIETGILDKSVKKYIGLLWNNTTESIKNVKFLRIDTNMEYVSDDTTILLQNKSVTIVSMIYNIKKREEVVNIGGKRNINKYMELGKEFILKLPYNLVVYTDEESIMYDIYEERKELYNKTIVIYKPLEDTLYYKYVDKIKELQNKYKILNISLSDTPLYIVVTDNKFYFTEEVVKMNPFNSSRFVWLDFGLNHTAKDSKIIHSWIYNIPQKIKQICINPYIEKANDKEMFKLIYHHTGGGIFTGSISNLLKYCNLIKQKFDQMCNEEWYQLDEVIMTIVIKENPELFELYFGDYPGSISNYLTPVHNIELILWGIKKCINYNNVNMAYNMLCYVDKYFRTNLNNENIYTYISLHIIADYYNNDKCLNQDVVYVINSLKKTQYERIHHLLKMNDNNLKFYANSDSVL